MKIKVQAQHLQLGDIVGSGEKVKALIRASIMFPASKVEIFLISAKGMRQVYWGKYTLINVERKDAKE